MKKRELVLCVSMLLFAYTTTTAQTAENKFAVGLHLLNTEYNGDYGNGSWKFNQLYTGWGLSAGMYYNPSFDFGLHGSYGTYGYVKDDANRFKINKFDMAVMGRFKFNNGYLLEETIKYSPFLAVGLGFATYSPRVEGYPDRVTEGTDVILPIGAGLKYQVTNEIAIQYQYLYHFTNSDRRDENRTNNPSKMPIYASKKGNDAFGEHLLSFVWTLPTATTGVKSKEDQRLKQPVKVVIKDNSLETQQVTTTPSSMTDEQEEVIHRTWYAMGSRQELKEEKILTADGWLRPCRVLESDFNKNYFKSIDSQATHSIVLYASKAKILTTHPTSSYVFKKVNDCVTLHIIDVKAFWMVSNYLVIEVY